MQAGYFVFFVTYTSGLGAVSDVVLRDAPGTYPSGLGAVGDVVLRDAPGRDPQPPGVVTALVGDPVEVDAVGG